MGVWNGIMFGFICLYEQHQNIETICFGRTFFGIPQRLDFFKRCFVIFIVANWSELIQLLSFILDSDNFMFGR